MPASKSKKSPPPSKLTPRDACEVSDDVHTDRLLAYKPIISSEIKPDPRHLNTKGQVPTGRNVGKLTELLKMPRSVFCEVYAL